MCMFCDRATKGVRICWKTLKNTIYYGHRCVHVVKSQITGVTDLLRIYAAKYHITNTIRYNHRHENIMRGEARLISQPLSAMMCTHAILVEIRHPNSTQGSSDARRNKNKNQTFFCQAEWCACSIASSDQPILDNSLLLLTGSHFQYNITQQLHHESSWRSKMEHSPTRRHDGNGHQNPENRQ